MNRRVMDLTRSTVEMADRQFRDSVLWRKTVPLWIEMDGLELPTALTTIRIAEEEPQHAIIITTMMMNLRASLASVGAIDELIAALQEARTIMSNA